MNVKELKALAKERGIKRYYRLRKAELIESLDTETPPTGAPATIMDEPATEIMDAPATIMDEPATEIMEEPATEIMDHLPQLWMNLCLKLINQFSLQLKWKIYPEYHPWWVWQKSKRIW